MPETRELEIPAARVREEAGGDGRTIEILAVPWNTPTGDGRTETGLSEQFAPGAFRHEQVIGRPLRWRHDEPIGVVTAARDSDEGLVVTARVADTTLGRDALALAREMGDALGASVKYREAPGTDWTARPVTIASAEMDELSLTDRPVYRTTRTKRIREESRMPDTDTLAPEGPATTEAVDDGRTRETPDIRDVTGTDLGAELGRLREQVATLSAGVSGATHGGEATSTLARFRSLGEWALETYRTTDAAEAATRSRALAEQLVAASPGVTQPTWLTDIKRLVDRGRPFLTNLGGGSALPPAPETPSWPYYDGALLDLVNEQAEELDEVTSVAVAIKRATGTIKTYAGGSHASYQLLERSSPSYYDAYLRILMLAWARRTEVQALAAAEAVVGATAVDDIFDEENPATLFTAVVEAEGAIADATGAGLDVVAVAPSKWTAIAGALDADGRPLFAAANPQNAGGVATARGAQGLAVAGVPMVRGAVETTAPIVATNRAAFAWLEEGPRAITQEQVSVLGRDVAVYGYASPAAYAPAGIIKITPTV